MPGLKMLFTKGKLARTNVELLDNELEYFRLIGEAYDRHLVERQSISSQKLTKLRHANPSQKEFFSYLQAGVPSLKDHSLELDRANPYSKVVLVGDKMFLTTCSKLKFNTTVRRQKDCRLAAGYFLVE